MAYTDEQRNERKEYTRLRNIAMKRVKRLEAAGLGQFAQSILPTQVLPLAYLDDADVKRGIRYLQEMLYTRPTTVTAARDRLATYQKTRDKYAVAEGSFADKDVLEFDRWMQWAREEGEINKYGSEKMAKFFGQKNEHKDPRLVFKKFLHFVSQQEKLENHRAQKQIEQMSIKIERGVE